MAAPDPIISAEAHASQARETERILEEVSRQRRLWERKRAKTAHHDPNSERWLISYSDLMTLLFGFFALLYSMANQFDSVQSAAEKQFGATTDVATRERSGAPKTRLDRMTGAAALEPCRLCVRTEEVSLLVAAELGIEPGREVFSEVLEDGPAWQAGIRPGDALLMMDGVEIRKGTDVHSIIDNKPPGAPISITISRKGVIRSISLEMDSLGANAKAVVEADERNAQFIKIGRALTVTNLTDAIRIRYLIPPEIHGALVSATAAQIKLTPGDVIENLRIVPIESADSLKDAPSGASVLMRVWSHAARTHHWDFYPIP